MSGHLQGFGCDGCRIWEEIKGAYKVTLHQATEDMAQSSSGPRPVPLCAALQAQSYSILACSGFLSSFNYHLAATWMSACCHPGLEGRQ